MFVYAAYRVTVDCVIISPVRLAWVVTTALLPVGTVTPWNDTTVTYKTYSNCLKSTILHKSCPWSQFGYTTCTMPSIPHFITQMVTLTPNKGNDVRILVSTVMVQTVS